METDLTFEMTPQILALIPIVAAILQVLKRIEPIQAVKQWLPFIAIGLAIGLAFMMKVPDPIMPGIVAGLMAGGAYDALKAPKPKGK